MTAMPTPIVMTGPGGDYLTRYYVKGMSLSKQIGSTLKQQSDTETAGSFAGYDSMPGRRGKRQFSDAHGEIVEATADGDAYERCQPVDPAYGYGQHPGQYGPGQYGQQHRSQGVPAIAAATAAAAAEAWLAAQQRTLVAIPLFTPASPAPASPPVARPAPIRINTAAPGTPVRTRRIPLVAATEMNSATPLAYRTAAAAWPRIAAAVPRPILIDRVDMDRVDMDRSDGMNGDGSEGRHEPLEAGLAVSADPMTNPTHSNQDVNHESHPQAIAHSHPHSRSASGTGLLADDAGTGRRAGRQQGHGVRARRGAHSKGSAVARSQQGTLFNG